MYKLNMILGGDYIKIIMVLIIICLLIYFLKKLRDKKKNRTNLEERSDKSHTLADCKSYEDLIFKRDVYQRRLEKQLFQNKKTIREAQKKGYLKSDIEWTKRFCELSEVANILAKNLEHENIKKLNESKFHRYTSLHFRGIILGDIAYKDYINSKETRNEINELLVSIGKKQVKVTEEEKKRLYETKDVCVDTTRYLYNRMVEVQCQTRKLSEKIRDECGERGRYWYEKIQRNKMLKNRKEQCNDYY